MRLPILPLLLWIPALAACATLGSGSGAASVEAELKETDVSFDRATQSHDTEGVGRLLCADALFGGRKLAAGREEALSRWAPFIAGGEVKLTWVPEKAAASSAGELGWTTGRYEFRAGSAEPERGQYATVWRRVDGRFCVSMDISLEAPKELLAAPRDPPLRTDRSASGDLVAETGWLTGEAGTWLEVKRCAGSGDCRVEVLSIVAAPGKKEP
ncbi:MAG TPA: nuclear transport factor 2 family protein [Myxococcales bacterium]|jgi:ketosteroid isomerase-like protein